MHRFNQPSAPTRQAPKKAKSASGGQITPCTSINASSRVGGVWRFGLISDGGGAGGRGGKSRGRCFETKSLNICGVPRIKIHCRWRKTKFKERTHHPPTMEVPVPEEQGLPEGTS